MNINTLCTIVQISTSVTVTCPCATLWQPVTTLLVTTPVPVTLDTLEMDLMIVQVLNVWGIYPYYRIRHASLFQRRVLAKKHSLMCVLSYC